MLSVADVYIGELMSNSGKSLSGNVEVDFIDDLPVFFVKESLIESDYCDDHEECEKCAAEEHEKLVQTFLRSETGSLSRKGRNKTKRRFVYNWDVVIPQFNFRDNSVAGPGSSGSSQHKSI